MIRPHLLAIADPSPEFDALRAALAAEREANEALTAAQEAHAAVDDMPREHEAAVRAAVAGGKRPPAALDPALVAAKKAEAEAAVRAAQRAVNVAAKAVEEVTIDARDAVRRLVMAEAVKAHAEAVEAIAAAKTADDRQHGLVTYAMSLDLAAAKRQGTAELGTLGRYLESAVHEEYSLAAQRDPSRFRTHAVPMAWQDIRDSVNGYPVAAFAPDPLASERFAKARGDAGHLKAQKDAAEAQAAERFAEVLARRQAAASSEA